MKPEDQILAGIEELANQMAELKKSIRERVPEGESNPDWVSRFDQIENMIKLINQESGGQNNILKEINSHYQLLARTALNKSNEVVHQYVEIKDANRWFWSIVSYVIVSLIIIFALIFGLLNKNEQLAKAKANDIKYRFLKVQNEPFSKLKEVATNTTELTYYFDSFYKSKPKEVEEYVLKKEELIRQAYEASEIAKQKEAESRQASEEALRLKNELNN